jgi:cytochrome P450
LDLDFALRPDEGLPVSAHHRLHAAGPVVWGEALGGWLVSSYDGVRSVLSDVARFTSAGTPVAEALGAEGMLVNDTPFHHTIRAVWAKQVSAAAMAARARAIAGYAGEVLETARPRLEAGERVDFIPLFRDFVMRFIADAFAVPRGRMGAFVRWTELSADTPAVAMAEGSEAQQRHFTAKQDVSGLVYEQMDDRAARFARGEDPQDFIALMVAAMDASGISRSVAADNLFNFILGAFDTTEKWLANIMVTLYSRAELFAELQADRNLIAPFNEEVMRFDCVAQTIQRRVREGGAELCGQRMAAGDTVFVLLGAANRDPAKFADPDRFDMRRPPLPHMGFGVGFHHCLGLHIVRLEAQVFIDTLLDTFPRLRVAAADYGESWALWGPRALHMERDAA